MPLQGMNKNELLTFLTRQAPDTALDAAGHDDLRKDAFTLPTPGNTPPHEYHRYTSGEKQIIHVMRALEYNFLGLKDAARAGIRPLNPGTPYLSDGHEG
jgi:hypothetical protein